MIRRPPEKRTPDDDDRAIKDRLTQGSTDSALAPTVCDVRDAARRALEQQVTFPRPKDEEWRFVRLDPIKTGEFKPVEEAEAEVTEAMVEPYTFDEADGRRLVFVNGEFDASLSSTDGFGSDIEVGHLADEDDVPETVAENLGEVGGGAYDGDFFGRVNTAGFRDAAYVVVPDDTMVDGPVHVLNLATESGTEFVAHPRTFLAVGRGAKMTVVEEYVGPSAGTYFNNVYTEALVGENATLTHRKVQSESPDAYHINRTAIGLTDGSTYDSTTVATGAKFSRFDAHSHGDGEEIDCTLDGLAALHGEQVSDTHTTMDHRQPNAGSHQLHKMILDDRAHSVFNGKIFVQQDAQKIDAYQLNRTLLLSDRAKVNTKPQLEIFADDVSCTHGATIGQLEEEQMFYLRSRGLDEAEARELLIYAFAAEIIETIEIEAVRERLTDDIAKTTDVTVS